MELQGRIEGRLKELRSELVSGREILRELEAKTAAIKTTLVRVSGAIQVLEELEGGDVKTREKAAARSDASTVVA